MDENKFIVNFEIVILSLGEKNTICLPEIGMREHKFHLCDSSIQRMSYIFYSSELHGLPWKT